VGAIFLINGNNRAYTTRKIWRRGNEIAQSVAVSPPTFYLFGTEQRIEFKSQELFSMSRNENQGLQIALILSVMLIVALGVTTYIFFRKAQEKTNDAQVAATKLSTAQQDRNAYQAGYEILKVMVGQSTTPKAQIDADFRPNLGGNPDVAAAMEKVDAAYEADMLQFGAGYDGAKTYHHLPLHLVAAIESKHQALKNANEGNRAAKAKVIDVQAQEQKKTQAAEASLQVALGDVAKLQETLRAETARMRGDTEKAAEQFRTESLSLKTVQEESKTAVAMREQQIRELASINEALRAKTQEEQLKVDNEQPDGRITWVNQRTQVVWIDLGLADGLRRSQTFSVVDRDETNLATATPKAQVEVTRLIDKHLAEARILSDNIQNPILPGDVFFSPAWSPGAKIHFALVGFLDYNEDGKSDHQLVRNIISVNNGEIDAEINPQGERVGNITTDTRYLVVGDRPNDRADTAALDAYTAMIGEAQRYGVEQISVKKLLTSMGFRGETRTVGLGRGATGADFRPSSKDGVTPSSNSGVFRNRRPPGAKGAY